MGKSGSNPWPINKQNYYTSFHHKDKLRLHLTWEKTLPKNFQKTFRESSSALNIRSLVSLSQI